MKIEEALKQCPVFSELNQAELKSIACLTEEKQYEAGTTIFQKGDDANVFSVLLEGKVALQKMLPTSQTGVHRRITVDIANPNEVINWSALVEPHTCLLGAVCLQNARVLQINGLGFEGLIRDEPKVGHRILKELVKVVDLKLEETRNILASERLVAVVKPD